MMDRTGEENSCVSIAEMSDPLRFAKSKLNFHPEPQQLPVFDPAIKRGILCCNRQWGKSTTLAALAVHRAWSLAPALILVVAPVVRQAYELILKIKGFLRELGVRTRQDGFNGVSLLLPNGSRIIAVPSDPDTIRGYSRVSMILIDEAARVSDDTFNAVTPAMARSNGVVWLMSTPKGRTGFFHALWSNGDPRWTRIHSTVADCSRISPEFLESERAAKPAADFEEDYFCVFQDTHDQFFDSDDIADAFSNEVDALHHDQARFSQTTALHYYAGIDLGKLRDHTAIAVLEHRIVNTGQRNPLTYEWMTETTREICHLERIPLRTPYDEVVRRIEKLMEREPLPGRSTLVVDATGPGAPVVDHIRRARTSAGLVSISITAGEKATHSAGINHVPKPQLISNLQLLLQNRRLKIANQLHEARTLRKELLEMRASSVHHGDLAMAVALAAWQARTRP